MSLQEPSSNLSELAEKWLKGTITEIEKEEFDQWYNSFDDSVYDVKSEISQELLEDRIHTKIFAKAGILEIKTFRLRTIYKYVAAASIVILVGAALLIISNQRYAVKRTALNEKIAPGGNKAYLILSNGKKISLNDISNGTLIKQGKSVVSKPATGIIQYNSDELNASAATSYNTIETPVGGQYRVKLPDGSLVVLNAGSSLRYPTSFAQFKKREVELTGEAYFEIKHDNNQPFRVKFKGQVVEDIGTHFDINSYDDEPQIKTTLLEGAVKVYVVDNAGNKIQTSINLIPGQQAVRLANANKFRVKAVNTEEVVAWKNGYFRFNDEKIQSIMRQLSRWYNIDVRYSGNISDEGYNGKISRFKNIDQVLDMLEEAKGVHFKVEGRRVTVLP